MAGSVRVTLTRALDHEYGAALTLATGVAIALAWSALSPSSYFTILFARANVRLLSLLHVANLHDVIVNLLMAIFFYALGLELSREFSSGALTKSPQAVPPVLGAVGGMTVTALGSLLLAHVLHSEALRRGWGVPMATDVAFTLGVLALAGRRLAPALRLFLLTLAITDDVLSVIVLSVTGTTHLRMGGLIGILIIGASGVALTRRATSSVTSVLFFAALWLCFAWANVEPALAGVLAGVLFVAPSLNHQRVERTATRLSVGVVLPLFALAACGLHWSHLLLRGTVGTVVAATIVIRLVGKTLGISAGVALARLLGFRLHPSITWPLVLTTALLCAIGFTVPLLFATKLFGSQSLLYAGYMLGLLVSSALAAGVGGALLLWRAQRD